MADEENTNATSKTNTPVGDEKGDSDAPQKGNPNAPQGAPAGGGDAGGPALDGPGTDPNRANARPAADQAAGKLNK